jgi:acyl-CoA synthetase (AMP-forming)/AMP-acid ligase II
MGEVGAAFVVCDGDSSPDADKIIEWSRGKMANYKVPRRIEFVDELPINATGKIVKDELRNRLTNA